MKEAFISVIKEMDKYAGQPWVDKRLWHISKNGYCLMVGIYEDKAHVSPYGFGGCEPLIAATAGELKECIIAWWRNRE